MWPVALSAVAILIFAATLGFFIADDAGRTGSLPHRVEKLVKWGGGCSPSQYKTPPIGTPVAALAAKSEKFAYITCGEAGPAVVYLKFKSAAQARRATYNNRTGQAICLVHDEILIDGLDKGFAALCKNVDGRLIAANA